MLVPTYNRAHFLKECLDSIIAQTVPPNQIIVINDGSTDDTKAVLKPYLRRIEYLERRNGGKSSALNLGLSKVTGHYVWILDDDNVALPDALEHLVAKLEQEPELGFTYSGWYMAATRPEDGRIAPGVEVRLPAVPEEEMFIRLMETNFIPCPLVRTSCYKKVGPFRTELVRSQDYDMALRLARHFRSAPVSGPTFYYRQHAGLRGSTADSFPAERNVLKWTEYDKIIFKELRGELDLGEYVPRRVDGERETLVDRRRAYLQRMAIMASKGLYDEMLDDLRLALAEESDHRPLSSRERAIVLQCANAGEEIFSQARVIRTIRTLCWGRVGREVRTCARAVLARVSRMGNKEIRCYCRAGVYGRAAPWHERHAERGSGL